MVKSPEVKGNRAEESEKWVVEVGGEPKGLYIVELHSVMDTLRQKRLRSPKFESQFCVL